MPENKVFVDTNILIYAYDLKSKEKHKKANELISFLWKEENLAVVSIQVLQEFYVNLIKMGCSQTIAQEFVAQYYSWDVIENTKQLFISALKVQKKFKLSFWDSSIVAAAINSDSKILYSEDLNNGQVFETVRVVNPFNLRN